MSDTIIVIPCYNEARRLDVEALRAFVDRYPSTSLLLVNDGSTDDTDAILRAFAADRPTHVSLHALPQNSGKGEAVRQGVRLALERSPSFVAYWDADLSTPLYEVARFRAVFDEQPDVIAVLGSRVRRLGADIQRRATRHYLGRLFATAASMALQLPTYDTQCGAKMFRVCPVVAAAFAQPFESRWIFDVELLSRLATSLAGERGGRPASGFFELPLIAWRDVAGSKLGPRNMVIAFVDLLGICWRKPRNRYQV